MKQITSAQLRQIIPHAGARADVFAEPLNAAMAEYDISTPTRAGMFIAQIAHESGSFRYVRELGNDAYLAKYDTGSLAKRLGNTPEADGDGQLYRGRGLIQITGRENYETCGRALGRDLLSNPELLETPELACRSAAWFWHSRDLNALADEGDFARITRKINGGLNGWDDRVKFWERAKDILGG